MSVLDSIDALQTDQLTIRRTTVGAPVNGIFPTGAPSTFAIIAVVQPAYNLNRVVGGADLHAWAEGHDVTDVRQMHTRSEIRTRTQTNAPDEVLEYEGATWTIIRVERWDLSGEIHFHGVLARQTGGGFVSL